MEFFLTDDRFFRANELVLTGVALAVTIVLALPSSMSFLSIKLDSSSSGISLAILIGLL